MVQESNEVLKNAAQKALGEPLIYAEDVVGDRSSRKVNEKLVSEKREEILNLVKADDRFVWRLERTTSHILERHDYRERFELLTVFELWEDLRRPLEHGSTFFSMLELERQSDEFAPAPYMLVKMMDLARSFKLQDNVPGFPNNEFLNQFFVPRSAAQDVKK